LGLGWQMVTVPPAGAGHAAKACEDRQTTNVAKAKLVLFKCRENNFMTMGPLVRNFVTNTDCNSEAKLLLSQEALEDLQ